MCELAPFQMECENDEFKHKLRCCSVYHFRQALNNFNSTLPIIGRFVEPYHCEGFKPKGGAK